MRLVHDLPVRPPAETLGQHVRRTASLAIPVMLGRMGLLVLVAIDIAMTGRAGTRELAAYAVAVAPQVPLLLFGVGLLIGTVVLSAQANGAGESHRCGAVWRVGLLHGLACGLVLGLLCQAGEPFLLLAGQGEALSASGGKVLAVLGWGLPGMLLFSATTMFLESIHRPVPGVLVMVGANLANALLNWMLIYGNLGAPALGAEGAALATTVVRWLMFVALATYVLARIDRSSYGVTGPIENAWDLGRRLRRIGYPMALAHTLESGAFAMMVLFAGWVGPVHVSAYTIAMNLQALCFMAAIGCATAASVRVGNAAGRGDPDGVRTAGWVAVALGGLFLAACSGSFLAAPGLFAGLYTDDPTVLALAVAAILIAAVALVPDGVQGVLIGALRGIGDVWPATGLYLVSFWLVMVPLGYLLGVSRGGGARGLMLAVLVGTVVASILLALRFHRVTGRGIRIARERAG